jgi:hypothetical protein
MPSGAKRRARQQRLQNAVSGRNSQFWKCPDCSRLILDMRGGRARHEALCQQRLNECNHEIEMSEPLSPSPNPLPVTQASNVINDSNNDPEGAVQHKRTFFRLPIMEEAPGEAHSK